MLDNPGKTMELLATLQAALPLEVGLTPMLARHLRSRDPAFELKERYRVAEISYLGDEGGIVCHLDPGSDGTMLLASLTHLVVVSSYPLAGAVARYQKHRIKMLKRQGHA